MSGIIIPDTQLQELGPVTDVVEQRVLGGAVDDPELEDKIFNNPLFLWLLENYVIPKTGKPYSFRGHAYAIDIVKDQHPFVAIKKSAQATASEILSALAMWVAAELGLNAVYAMPAFSQMQLFSHARVQRAIMMSPKIRAMVTGVTNVSQKELGKGVFYLIGSQDYRQLITIDGDCLLIDEIDGHNQENIPILEQRIEHSNLRWRRYASTPTLPDYGIDQIYLEGDRRQWFIRCECCGEIQTLEWDRNVVENMEGRHGPGVVCAKCRKRINRLADGEWVPEYPSRSDECHSYYINKLFCERADIGQLIKRSKMPRYRKDFYNSDLGLAYTPAGGKITREEILAIATAKDVPDRPDNGWMVVAGVDVGPRELYVGIDRLSVDGKRLGLVRKKIESSTAEAFDELEKRLRHWKVRCAVLDAQPETRLVKALTDKSWPRGGRMLRCYFRPMTEEYHVNNETRTVNANRTMVCDEMTAAYRRGTLKLPESVGRDVDYIAQMGAPVRITHDPNKMGVALNREARAETVIYAKTHKPDHHFFVEVYLWIAADIMPAPARTIFKRPF